MNRVTRIMPNTADATSAPVTLEQLTQELRAVHAAALECRDPQGAIDALMAIAELHGLLVDWIEILNPPRAEEG